jgi:mutator protein MutT
MKETHLAGYTLVLMRKGNQVLLIKRSDKAKFAPGHYSLVGGSVEKGETYRQSLVREVHEEIGATILPADLRFVHVFYRNGTEHELVCCIFECSTWEGKIYNKEPDKHSDLSWFDLDHLPEKMIPAHRNALKLIAQQQLYSEQ